MFQVEKSTLRPLFGPKTGKNQDLSLFVFLPKICGDGLKVMK